MIYTGKSEDGSDMYPAEGLYVSPDGSQWSNKPYTKEDKMWHQLYEHLAKNLRTLREEHSLILEKKSTLNSRLRNYVKDLMEK